MEIVTYGEMGIRGKNSVTIPWGKSPATTPTDLFLEAEVRDIFQQESRVAYAEDNSDKDLDPAKGRALHRVTGGSESLAFGRADCVAECNFDATGVPTSFHMESRQKNFLQDVKWNQGEIHSVREERVLKDGTREVLDIHVDPTRGVLTFITDRIPAHKT